MLQIFYLIPLLTPHGLIVKPRCDVAVFKKTKKKTYCTIALKLAIFFFQTTLELDS